MDRLQNSFMSIEQVKDTYFNYGKENVNSLDKNSGIDFKTVLDKVSEERVSLSEVTFSKHANERLLSRNINLSEEQITRLNDGIRQAKEKSINESLVMMDNLAFIVNVKNNTVITAMEQETEDSNVFTNIDGAVIV